MKKLNYALKHNNLTVYGFPAFKALEDKSNKEGRDIVLSTLAPGVMMDMDIPVYYSPVLPQGVVFNTPEEIIAADLDVVTTMVLRAPDIEPDSNVVIVSRRQGTVDILKDMYPNHTVLASVTPDDIMDKNVVGTLPPTLAHYASTYRAVTIKDFDHAKDGDLAGQELKERMILTDPVVVRID